VGQRFADAIGAVALQPEFGGGFVTPVVEGVLAGAVGLNVIKTRQAVFHPLGQRDINVFTLPGVQHLLAEIIRAQGSHIVDRQRISINLTGNIHRGV